MVNQDSDTKKVPVVQAYKHTKYLGHLNLKFDDNDKLIESNDMDNPILLDHTHPQGKNSNTRNSTSSI